MTDEREDAPLWVGALACALVALAVAIAPAVVVALAAWAVRLLVEGLVWLVLLAWVGGVVS